MNSRCPAGRYLQHTDIHVGYLVQFKYRRWGRGVLWAKNKKDLKKGTKQVASNYQYNCAVNMAVVS